MHRSPGHAYWIKTFPEDEVPININILSSINLPLSAEMYMEILDPKTRINEESGIRVFVDHGN